MRDAAAYLPPVESEDDGNIRFKDLSGDNLWINPAALRLARGKHGKKKAFAQQLFIKKTPSPSKRKRCVKQVLVTRG